MKFSYNVCSGYLGTDGERGVINVVSVSFLRHSKLRDVWLHTPNCTAIFVFVPSLSMRNFSFSPTITSLMRSSLALPDVEGHFPVPKSDARVGQSVAHKTAVPGRVCDEGDR